jgi:starch synthase
MSKKKVLIVSQEMEPYTAASEIAQIARKLPQYIQEQGMEIRVLMPRFGSINERRHRLHEVVRLSGMNIIVDDEDYPLIIKVASLPEARMQVYFLDNDDFFRRKSDFADEEGKAYEDNIDRMVFFCKGVIETVKKFGWAPDIVHCHGWMTSLVPLYLKTAYKTDPLFQHTKVVYSVYNESLGNFVDDSFLAKASINNLSADDLSVFHDESGIILGQGAISYSDGIVKSSEILSEAVQAAFIQSDKPVLDVQGEGYLAAYFSFYKGLMGEPVAP